MRHNIELLAKQYRDVFEDEPWYGDSARMKLATLDVAVAITVIPGLRRSISQVVAHMTAYHRFAIARLQGDTEFSVPLNSTVDWPDLSEVKDWPAVYHAFEETRKELYRLIIESDDAVLQQEVAGKAYDFQFLLDGIVQHTAYHLGQIGILHRLAAQQQGAGI